MKAKPIILKKHEKLLTFWVFKFALSKHIVQKNDMKRPLFHEKDLYQL